MTLWTKEGAELRLPVALLEQLWKTQEGCFSLRIRVSSARPSHHVHLPQYVMLIPCQHWSAATVPDRVPASHLSGSLGCWQLQFLHSIAIFLTRTD